MADAEQPPVRVSVFPREEDLVAIADRQAFMEHRDGETLVWPDDWWDYATPTPLGVLPRVVDANAAECWFAGHRAGRTAGHREGRRQGFGECQAGFRAMLGAASASDVGTLLQAARDAAP